jgi:hypothetical protein
MNQHAAIAQADFSAAIARLPRGPRERGKARAVPTDSAKNALASNASVAGSGKLEALDFKFDSGTGQTNDSGAGTISNGSPVSLISLACFSINPYDDGESSVHSAFVDSLKMQTEQSVANPANRNNLV